MKKPLISICLVTHQTLYPMVKYDKDIFTILLDSLGLQSFKSDIELIIVDRFYDERIDTFKYLNLDYPFKYLPPKPSPWLGNRGYKTCNDRNSALLLSSGELIVVLDDCTILSHPDLLEQMWHYYKHWILLKPLLDGRNYESGKVEIQEDTLKSWAKTQDDTENFVRLGSVRALESSGHRGGVFAFPSFIYDAVNGFDEEMDGDYGSEDTELNERVDAHGYFRYILEAGQHPFVRIHHDEFKENSNTLVRHKCNIAYIQWKRRADLDIRTSANRRKITQKDIDVMKTWCESCTSLSTCGRRIAGVPPNLDLYEKNFRPIDIKKTRREMIEKFGKRTGAFDPWKS